MATKIKRPKQAKTISVVATEEVPISSLKTYRRNPRIGNIEAIQKSLKTFGQYQPVIANKRDGQILVHNHTYLAKRKNGDDTILVSWVDVDEKTAKAMVLADNKLAELGTYDDQVLAELLNEVGVEFQDVTGFNAQEVSDLLATLESLDPEDPFDDDDDDSPESERRERPDLEPMDENEGVIEDFDETPDPTSDDFRKASDELSGAFDLKDEATFEGVGYWEIPKIRKDMLMQPEELPEKLLAWAGSATKDWPDKDVWWLYNYGVDSTSGMNDVSKMILSFYCWDDYFENWWHYPSRYVAKILNSRVKYAITPNFSTWQDQPNALNLYNLYRSRWLGRYFQEAGVKIIVNLEWPVGDEKFLTEVLKGVPTGAMISIQGNSVVGAKESTEVREQQKKQVAKEYRHVVDTLKPSLLLYYGSPEWNTFVKELKLPCKVRFVENRMVALSEQAKKRTKKTGL